MITCAPMENHSMELMTQRRGTGRAPSLRGAIYSKRSAPHSAPSLALTLIAPAKARQHATASPPESATRRNGGTALPPFFHPRLSFYLRVK